MNITVSIGVAIYKVEDYLEQCLDSILGQTYPNLDIILVDDGSPDNCPGICDNYAKKDSRIRVIHKANEGLVRARKSAVTAAVGTYMLLMDGDDRLDASWVETLVKALEADTDAVIGRFARAYGDKNVPEEVALPAGVYEAEKLDDVKKKMIFDIDTYSFSAVTPSVWNKLLVREKLLSFYRNMPDNLTLGEDMALTMPYLIQAKKIVVVNEPVFYYYVQRQDSMVKAFDSRLADNLASLKAYMDSLTWSSSDREQLDYYFAYLFVRLVRNQLASNENYKTALAAVYTVPGIEDLLNRIDYRRIPRKPRIVLTALKRKHFGVIKTLAMLSALFQHER